MKDFDDPLDLLDDDGDGVVEISLMEEEKGTKDGRNNKSGCCVVLLLLGSLVTLTGWLMSWMI